MDEISIKFDENLKAFIVTLPKFVTLEALEIWERAFLQAVGRTPGKAGLLFDTNAHSFESIECLMWLRQFFTQQACAASIDRIAFIQPVQYRSAGIVSDKEAYFTNVQDARDWLRQVQREFKSDRKSE